MRNARVLSLVEEAIESGRTAEEICQSCPDLLPAVSKRLREYRRLQSRLDELFPRTPEATPTGAVAPLPALPGYEMLSTLGAGGMAVVYLARHLSLGRHVAVKMLLAGPFSRFIDRERLLREARAMANLHHPNIVSVHDVGEIDGHPYFTMEYMEGGSLAEQLAGQPTSPVDAAKTVHTLAAAVSSAHRCGIIHRDLKPANVLLAGDGTLKVSDFGIARSTLADTAITHTGARLGTPSYMAPEQALGRVHDVGPATDVHALGAILYELLTGRPPFGGTSAAETERQVIDEDPVAPRLLVRALPRDIETICLKCLRKEPQRRYPTAHLLAEDLGRYLRGEPIAARKTGAIVRAAKWARRHPTKTVVLGFALLIAVVAIVGGAWQIATNAASRHAVEHELDEVERAQQASDWVVAGSAMDRAAIHLGAGGPVDLRSRLADAQRNARVVRSLEDIEMTRALGSGSRASFEQSDRDYASSYRDACRVTDKEPPEESARRIRASTIRTALTAAMYDWLLCAKDGARRAWMLAVLRIEDSDQGGWRDRARDAAMRSDRDAVLRLLAEFRAESQSPQCSRWFAEVIRQVGGDPTTLLRKVQSVHADDFWVNYALAEALHRRGQDREAMRFAQAAMALRPEVAVAHNLLGKCLFSLNRFEESITQLREAIHLDPTAPAIHGNLALSLSAIGRDTEAIEHVKIGLKGAPDYATFHTQLGSELQMLGQEEEAIEHFKQAVELAPDSAAAKDVLINELILARRGSDAVPAFRSWIARSRGSFPDWEGLADICLFVGSKEDYEATRTKMLESFGASTDPVLCERLVRACMLAPIPDGELQVARAAIDRALASEQRQPTRRSRHLQLVKAMSEYRAGDPETTVRLIDDDVARVVAPVPQLFSAMALADLHRDAEAKAALAWAAAIGDWRPAAAFRREWWMCQALRREAESKVLPNLDAFTQGKHWTNDPQERLALIATAEARGMHHAAARLFSEGFASDPALANDVEDQLRYRAACAAARCGCNPSAGDPSLTPEAQARWRAQALQWLREDLASLQEGTPPADRAVVLAKWCTDPDLRSIRDPARLDTLPESERSAFGALWAQVSGVLAATEY